MLYGTIDSIRFIRTEILRNKKFYLRPLHTGNTLTHPAQNGDDNKQQQQQQQLQLY